MRAIMPLAVAVLVSCVTATAVFAAWIDNGNPVCIAPGWQIKPIPIPDGNQGAFISWWDMRSGDYDVYVQHINEQGVIQWVANGVAVCTMTGDQERPEITQDGTGGIIVTWGDARGSDWDIYAQRVDASGATLWATDGIALCTLPGDQRDPRIMSDGAGGAIIAWPDNRTTGGISAQRIDQNGNILWTTNGVVISNAGGVTYWPSLTTDGAGGAIITWWDNRSGDNDMYAQRVDPNGTVLWTTSGVVICDEAGDQLCGYNRYVISDGSGGAIIIWEDDRDVDLDIYAQRIDANGNPLWMTNGNAICTAAGDQSWPGLATDGAGGAIIVWRDNRSVDFDVYAQRITAGGMVQWTNNGEAVCTAPYDQSTPKIATDGAGGAVIAWRDWRCGGGMTDIFAQRIDDSGNVLWSHDGEPVCIAYYTQGLGHIAPDGVGGAIVVWQDYRHLEYDIYAYRINPDYTPPVSDPNPTIIAVDDIPNDQGGKLGLQWENSGLDVYPITDISHYSVWRRLPKADVLYLFAPRDSLRSFRAPKNPDEPVRRIIQGGYAWEWIDEVPASFHDAYALTVQSLYDSIGTDPGWQYFMVRANTDDPLVYYDSPIDSGYSVDNLSPYPPQGAVASQVAPPYNMLITWNPNSEDDLHYYRIYRSTSADFEPGPANILEETTHTLAYDPGWYPGANYYYKLAALDVHGNESESTLIMPDDIIATMLQSFSASTINSGIEVTWQLSFLESDAEFLVLRSEVPDGTFFELQDPDLTKEGLTFTFRDSECLPGKSYRYRVDVSDADGRKILFETDVIATPSMTTTLYQNHPNPFNPSTVIRFYIDEPGSATIGIFDVSGRLVRRLVTGWHEAGFHTVEWNGMDGQGVTVSSGMYFYRLRLNKLALTRKMVLLR